VRVLDLVSQLNTLTSSQLNVAAQGDLGIDWAMLELQVAPALMTYTNSILPEADAYVRGGTNASLNFGTDTTIDVKADTSANTQRQGYLRWNLAGYAGNFVQARVRLTPTSVGTNGLENAITLTTSNQWDEASLTWSNQPTGGKRFATWIPAANVPVEFDVTPQVQAALAGDGLLSFELFSLSYVGGPGLVSYASRENATVSRRPQLLLIHTNSAPADSVGDGIPDWWRAQYFGGSGTTTNSLTCANCDADGDGVMNLAEFLSGTVPTNSSSYFGITAVAAENNDLRVTWATGIGKTNALQAVTGVGYTNDFSDIFSVTNTAVIVTNYLDAGAVTNAPSRYYRVRLVP
jgi:hypothetical protein